MYKLNDTVESIIPIETDIRTFYKQYLNVIKPLLRPHLTKGEINVLAELLYLNYTYRNIDPKYRGKIIFDYDNKIAIIDHLDTSYQTLGNIFLSLRKKNYIKGNQIKESLLLIPEEEFKLSYKFKIK